MVGYEPDLKRPFNWTKDKKDIKKFLDGPSKELITEIEDDLIMSSLLLKPADDDGYTDHLTKPLLQVCSVHVVTNFNDGESSEIYGSIIALESPDSWFSLYDRDIEYSENISGQGILSLTGPNDVAILPSTTLFFCLKDKIHGVDVVKGKLVFDPMTEDSYDKLMYRDVEGPNGFARVHYIVFRFAIYAMVNITLTENEEDDKKCKATEIYGSVVADYENVEMYRNPDLRLDLLETCLFDKPSHQPLSVMVGTPIKLSRNVVTLPAYSSLMIKVKLWDSGGKIVDDCLKFECQIRGYRPQYIQTQYTCVGLSVEWKNAYFYAYKKRKGIVELNGELLQEKLRIFEDLLPSTSLIPRIPSTSSASSYNGNFRAEVYTVFVGGITEKISALCGSILLDDASGRFSIYNRDESCRELLRVHGLACIEGNYRSIQNSNFYIILNLKDPVQNLEVSRGYMGWNIGSIQANMLLDRPMCSVVRGKDGYAAVHYEIFESAFDALVEVKLFANDHPDTYVYLHGTLVARYSDHDYSTSYQKKYYTSRLYDYPRYRSLYVEEGSKVTLLKSIVVVPGRSCLIIEADLGVFDKYNVHEPIKGMAEFEIDMCDTVSKMIRGEHYWIEVSVKFKV